MQNKKAIFRHLRTTVAAAAAAAVFAHVLVVVEVIIIILVIIIIIVIIIITSRLPRSRTRHFVSCQHGTSCRHRRPAPATRVRALIVRD